MINSIHLICLGVKDIDKSLNFYQELGFNTTYKNGSPIVFFNNNGTKLELFPINNLINEIYGENNKETLQASFTGITLACNMKSTKEVDELIKLVDKAGGKLIKSPFKTDWGGYSGYFADLDGYIWEVAYGPMWQFDDNDMLIID